MSTRTPPRPARLKAAPAPEARDDDDYDDMDLVVVPMPSAAITLDTGTWALLAELMDRHLDDVAPVYRAAVREAVEEIAMRYAAADARWEEQLVRLARARR